jgi:hypothetical protein
MTNIDRSDAVNLARNLKESDMQSQPTPKGVRLLIDAVLAMDEVLSTESTCDALKTTVAEQALEMGRWRLWTAFGRPIRLGLSASMALYCAIQKSCRSPHGRASLGSLRSHGHSRPLRVCVTKQMQTKLK